MPRETNKYSELNTKEKRLEAIRRIVGSRRVRNQEELLQLLAKSDIEATQATLSRDIKQLKIVKAHDPNGDYYYVLHRSGVMPGVQNALLADEDLRLEFSGDLAVMKTRPGYAMGIASDIDTKNPEEILGTIAGDDTILIIPREGYTREEVATALSHLLHDK